MSLYSQNRFGNVSAIGEKFIFSNFLKPVSEEEMNAELQEIDAWLEANDVSTSGTDSADEKVAIQQDQNNADNECGKACKESVEEVVEESAEATVDEAAIVEDLESMVEDTESLDETTAAQVRNSKITRDAVKKAMKNNPTAASARKNTPLMRKGSDTVDPNMTAYNKIKASKESVEENIDEELAREALEEWYNENGYEITDYEQGRIDMFVEMAINEFKHDIQTAYKQRELADKQSGRHDKEGYTKTSYNPIRKTSYGTSNHIGKDAKKEADYTAKRGVRPDGKGSRTVSTESDPAEKYGRIQDDRVVKTKKDYENSKKDAKSEMKRTDSALKAQNKQRAANKSIASGKSLLKKTITKNSRDAGAKYHTGNHVL